MAAAEAARVRSATKGTPGRGSARRGAMSTSPARRDSVGASESPYPVEAQFFGVCPLGFIEDILNAVDDYINDAVDAAEGDMEAALPPASAVAAARPGARNVAALAASRSAKLTQCCDKLVALLRKKFDKHLDLFEMYSLRNIFRVPADVHTNSELDTSLTPDTSYTEEQEREVEARVEELRVRIAQARHKRRALLKSVALFERRLPRFERKASEIEALHATFASAGVPDPVEAVQSMIDATAAMKDAERQVVEYTRRLANSSRAANQPHASGAGGASAAHGATMDGLEETFGDDRLLVGGTDDIHMREAAHYMGAAVDDDHV